MASSPCGACHRGTLVARKKHRLSLGFVITGYTLVALSALALLLAIGIMLFAWAITQAGLPAEAQAELDRTAVPEHIQGKVARHESIPDSALNGLTPEQKKAVRDGQGRMHGQILAFGFLAVMFGISGAILGILSLCGLIVGALLVLRRRVFVCDRCGAVTP